MFFLRAGALLVITVVAGSLLAIFLYRREINRGVNKLHRRLLAPVTDENKRTNRSLTRKIKTVEQRMNSMEQALEKFTAAIEVYAQHLSSHTSAIQNLSEASHELKRGAAEQNRVLMHLMEILGQPGAHKEGIAPEVKPEQPPEPKQLITDEVGKKQFPPGCVRNRLRLPPGKSWEI